MHVLVIGGSRFIGPQVVQRLDGHDVTIYHRGVGCMNPTHIHDDVANLAAHALRADVVIDLWAMSEQHAEALVAARIAPRLVVISSQDVYRQFDRARGFGSGPPDPLPLAEDAPLRERLYPYGTDYEKLAVERVVMREPGATVLRLPAVYGPGDYRDRFRAWRQPRVRMIEAQARWRWTRGYVENIADAIVLAAMDDRAAGNIYNVGEPDAPAEAEWARMVGAEVDIVAEVEDLPGFDWNVHVVTDSSKIRRELGYAERVSRSEAIRRTVN